ncbi:hypothetical protein K474DRAFT_817935 [Panus rudis PR-1116 ss-1]|nr:hypothetical protein K474DRAFT_817935 [Panus rudis PR-1116 ss-1]
MGMQERGLALRGGYKSPKSVWKASSNLNVGRQPRSDSAIWKGRLASGGDVGVLKCHAGLCRGPHHCLFRGVHRVLNPYGKSLTRLCALKRPLRKRPRLTPSGVYRRKRQYFKVEQDLAGYRVFLLSVDPSCSYVRLLIRTPFQLVTVSWNTCNTVNIVTDVHTPASGLGLI